MAISALEGPLAVLQSLVVAHTVQLLTTFDGTYNGNETEQLNVPMSLADYQLLDELLFGTPEQQTTTDDPDPSALLQQLGKNLQNLPIRLAYNSIRQQLIIMFSTELRRTFSQELGSILRDRLACKLSELANDKTLTPILRDESQSISDMLIASYDSPIINPCTGTHEMIVPAVLLLADDKGNMDKPLIVLMVDFSGQPDDEDAARLLDIYPDATIIRVDIPYRNPDARMAAYSIGDTASAYSCSYDIIIRASTATTISHKYSSALPEPSSSSLSSNKLRYLIRNRPLVKRQKDSEDKSIELPLAMLLPELTWRITMAHPAAAGQLTVKLRYASLRRCLTMAAVRQKNMDLLRHKSTEARRPSSADPPLGALGFGLPPYRRLHTLTRSFTPAPVPALAPATTHTRIFDTDRKDGTNGFAVMPRRRGLDPSFAGCDGRILSSSTAVAGLGVPKKDVSNLRTWLDFGRRLARLGRL
ncbi:hypothetical protein VP1G_09902 [Cytospora mali]|uniref:Uncharacterized protein n=1 Tax=Cytospora mali TaxID=578113 RepID=A0A194VFJ0_CYTMA|nr:hypothetical protein VP1G_09902 [Valsa mali var. pyri (nom. inval.)]